MICPDCEIEVEKLIKSTNTCMSCYKRMQDAKYHNKEYKPLKDIKGTTEYNRAMGRKLAAMERKNRVEVKTKPQVTVKTTKYKIEPDIINTEITSIEGYEYININSNRILETIEYLKCCLDSVPKMEEQVTKMREELNLITHQKTETDGPGDPRFDELNAREYSIIKYRRTIKDALAYLRRINTNILNDNLMNDLDETQKDYEKDMYVPKYDREDRNQYTVSVNVSGLHGSSRIELFKRHVYAKDEVGAKSYVENYLNGLHGITIYGKSWLIREVNSYDVN